MKMRRLLQSKLMKLNSMNLCRYFAFDEMTHSAFMPKLVPQPPFAPPDDLLRNFGSRR